MVVGRSNIRRLHHSDATVDPADICAGDAAVLLAEGTDQQDEAVAVSYTHLTLPTILLV